MSIVMKIDKCSDNSYWYKDYVGSVLNVSWLDGYGDNCIVTVEDGEHLFPNEIAKEDKPYLCILFSDLVCSREPIHIKHKEKTKCILVNLTTHNVVDIEDNEGIMDLDDAKGYIFDSDNPYDYQIIEVTGRVWETNIVLKEKNIEEKA